MFPDVHLEGNDTTAQALQAVGGARRLTGELFSPAEASIAGSLDRVVPAGELGAAVDEAVDKPSKISLDAHAATKVLVGGAAIATFRAAIDRDMPLEDSDPSHAPTTVLS